MERRVVIKFELSSHLELCYIVAIHSLLLVSQTQTMQLIHEDKQKRVIREKEEIKFSSYSAFHLIVITARTIGDIFFYELES